MQETKSNQRNHPARYLTAALAVSAVLLCASATQARDRLSTEQTREHARERVEQLRDRLQLTEEQEQQIRPILADNGKRMRELRESFRDQERSSESMNALHQEIETMQSETREKLEPILSAEQLAEYDRVHEEWREERRSRREGKPRNR